MNLKERRAVIGVSAAIFTVLIATLTALRLRNTQPPTFTQSLIVQAGALLLLASITYYACQGGGFLEGWILAYGPVQAFTLNLFLAEPIAKLISIIGYAIISAIIVSVAIGLTGFGAGRALNRFRAEQQSDAPS